MHDTDPVSHGHGLDLIVSHVSGSGFAFGQNPLQLGTHFHPQQRVEVRQGFGDIEDTAVSTETAVRLLEHAAGPDMRLLLVKGADHRFSDEKCLRLIETAVLDVLGEA